MAAKPLLDAKREGLNPGADPDLTAAQYRKPRFYQVGVYGDCQAADGCLIGWFAVDKVTARVLGTVTIEEEKGPELEAVQKKLRASHCISDEMVKAARNIWP